VSVRCIRYAQPLSRAVSIHNSQHQSENSAGGDSAGGDSEGADSEGGDSEGRDSEGGDSAEASLSIIVSFIHKNEAILTLN
jgi:hypothetical protein